MKQLLVSTFVFISAAQYSVAKSNASTGKGASPAEKVKMTDKTGDVKKDTTLPEGDTVVVVKPGADFFPGGCGFRKALAGLVKIYQICFFGKNMKASEWLTAFDAPAGKKAYKFKLSFLRAVGGKKVSAAFSEGITKTPSENKLEELERQKFIAWASKLNIDRESTMEFTFNDKKAFEVEFYQKPNGGSKAETFESSQKGMAKALVAIWLGPKPLSEDLKTELLK